MTSENLQALINKIKLDQNEASGSCTRDTGKVIKAVADHLLSHGLSEEFESVLNDYREQLGANVECNSSWRHAQRIDAILLKQQGIYFIQDKWGKVLNQWIESNADQVVFISALDDLFRVAPKSKPTKKWCTQVKAFCNEYTEDAVLGFIRQAIELFLEPDEIAVSGIYFDNEDKLRAMLQILTLDGDDSDSPMLRRLASTAYKKVPYKGPVSTSVGNLCVNALFDSPGPQGLVQLTELASEIKYPSNATYLLKKKLQEAATVRGTTVQALQNQAVPDHGLSD